mmetsp:Transcript_91645/g.284984  ORF Transcript_91645/g.284984 Transcript_91645/m.284984 type:complete len:143 (+) Transcript_91645:814-1242(+)
MEHQELRYRCSSTRNTIHSRACHTCSMGFRVRLLQLLQLRAVLQVMWQRRPSAQLRRRLRWLHSLPRRPSSRRWPSVALTRAPHDLASTAATGFLGSTLPHLGTSSVPRLAAGLVCTMRAAWHPPLARLHMGHLKPPIRDFP